MVVPSTSTEKSIGTLAGASIRCWPMTTPASAVAVVSTIVTIATAAGVRVTVSSVVSEPVTELLAAMAGMTNSAAQQREGDPEQPEPSKGGTRTEHGKTSGLHGRTGRILRTPTVHRSLAGRRSPAFHRRAPSTDPG